MADKFVIQFTGNVNQPQPTNFCMGVGNAGPNAPVVLANLGATPNTMWTAAPVTGVISSVANPSLCLTISSTAPHNGTPLVLQTKVPGSLNQTWNWLGNSPRILSTNFPQFGVDDPGCTQTAGTKLQAYDLSG